MIPISPAMEFEGGMMCTVVEIVLPGSIGNVSEIFVKFHPVGNTGINIGSTIELPLFSISIVIFEPVGSTSNSELINFNAHPLFLKTLILKFKSIKLFESEIKLRL